MTNLITNGTFETNINGWTSYQSSGARDTTNYAHGVASMKRTATIASNPGCYSNAMTLVNGKSYRWDCWLLGTGTVRVGFFTSAFISGSYKDCVMSPTVWTRFTFDWVSNVSAAYLFFAGQTVASGASYNIDEVNVDLTPVTPTPPSSGGGSLIRDGAKKSLTDYLIQSGAKKSATLHIVRNGAEATIN